MKITDTIELRDREEDFIEEAEEPIGHAKKRLSGMAEGAGRRMELG